MLPTLRNFLKQRSPSFEQHLKNGDCVHIIIDAQRRYCDPNYEDPDPYNRHRGTDHTDSIAKRIANVSDQLRQIMPTIIVYYSPTLNAPVHESVGGLHHLTLESGDITCSKNTDSAFDSGQLKGHLKKVNPAVALFSGFNAGACVKSTVIDACDHNIVSYVFRDCVGQDQDRHELIPHYLNVMQKNGAHPIHSDNVFNGTQP